jgi:hypothetical protein
MDDPRSNSYEGFIAALQILAKYEPKELQEKFIFEAEHDIIYSHVSADDTSEIDADALEALGWHEDCSINVWAYFT